MKIKFCWHKFGIGQGGTGDTLKCTKCTKERYPELVPWYWNLISRWQGGYYWAS